ncbi:MAG: hypothetical protein KC613_25210, partial [Myxococcales bacterium]|nr:hypothetical protein [Myxococcales bacterium]
MFQPTGVVELRPDPSATMALEIRTERGSGRVDRHEWQVGERTAAIEIIRYDRGQPVDQHRLSRGDAARISAPDEHSTLRLRATGIAGPPRLLEVRLVPRAATVPGTQTPQPELPRAELRSEQARPELPRPEL